MSRKKGVSAERIAKRLLKSKGFTIKKTRYELIKNQERITEIDIIAEDPAGIIYAVEVKAGKGSVSTIRRTYANAQLVGYKPLLICKGFTDKAAIEAAEKLSVLVVKLDEYYLLLEPEELESLIKKCLEEVLETHGFLPYYVELGEDELNILKALSNSETFKLAAEKLNKTHDELGNIIRELTKEAILPQRSLSFHDLKRVSSSILARNSVNRKLDSILERIEKLERFIRNSS
jgi:predicted RecB family endonuclease